MKKTKRITAAVLAAMLLALSLFSAYAEPQTKTEIYSENSAGETVVRIQIRLRELGLLRGEDAPGSHRFMTTDNVLRFIRTGSLFLGHPLKSAEVSLVDLS